jgi:hypothetical protein
MHLLPIDRASHLPVASACLFNYRCWERQSGKTLLLINTDDTDEKTGQRTQHVEKLRYMHRNPVKRPF